MISLRLTFSASETQNWQTQYPPQGLTVQKDGILTKPPPRHCSRRTGPSPLALRVRPKSCDRGGPVSFKGRQPWHTVQRVRNDFNADQKIYFKARRFDPAPDQWFRYGAPKWVSSRVRTCRVLGPSTKASSGERADLFEGRHSANRNPRHTGRYRAARCCAQVNLSRRFHAEP
jgi:hypothetical protein